VNSTVYRILWRAKKAVQQPALFALLKERQALEHGPRERIEATQLQRLRELLERAYETTAFYRRRLDQAGVRPRDVRSLADLRSLPVLNKEDVRRHIEEFVSSQADRRSLIPIYSGGSTGIPTMVYQPRSWEPFGAVKKVSFYRMLGLEHGDKTAHLWGLNRRNAPVELGRNRWWLWCLRNEMALDAFDLTEERMGRFVEWVRRFRPKLLIGYTSALVLFSEFIRKRGLSIPGLRAVCSTAEKLHDEQRDLIESALRAPVFNLYGSTEIPWIACECRAHQGLHVFEESRIVECVPSAGIEEGGRLLVTDLENTVCPLIRYDLGDLGTLDTDPCPCGRSTLRIRRIHGRVSDLFRFSGGRTVHGEYFTHVFYGYKDRFRQFQVHQLGPTRLLVRLVPSAGRPDAGICAGWERELVEAFCRAAGGRVDVEFEYLSVIPPDPSGKYRFTRSDLDDTAHRP
jgi:phenylacetate-CoA ligase